MGEVSLYLSRYGPGSCLLCALSPWGSLWLSWLPFLLGLCDVFLLQFVEARASGVGVGVGKRSPRVLTVDHHLQDPNSRRSPRVRGSKGEMEAQR